MEPGSVPAKSVTTDISGLSPQLDAVAEPDSASSRIAAKQLVKLLRESIVQLLPEFESRLRWLLDARRESAQLDGSQNRAAFPSDPRDLVSVGREDGLWAPCCGDASRILGVMLRRAGFQVKERCLQGVLGDDWYYLAPFPHNRSPFNGHMLLVAEASDRERIIIDPTYRQFAIFRIEREASRLGLGEAEFAEDLPRAEFPDPIMVLRESKLPKFVGRLSDRMAELGDSYAVRSKSGQFQYSMVERPLLKLWDLSNYKPSSPQAEEILKALCAKEDDDPLLREALQRAI